MWIKDGVKGQCQVMINATKQCSNPANYLQSNGKVTCRTMDKVISRRGLQHYSYTKVKQAYDLSLWGSGKAPVEASEA